jgi:hypothetical protein
MGEGDRIYFDLKKVISWWEFIYSYSRRRYNGLISGWRPRFDTLAFYLSLGMIMDSWELGVEVSVSNI